MFALRPFLRCVTPGVIVELHVYFISSMVRLCHTETRTGSRSKRASTGKAKLSLPEPAPDVAFAFSNIQWANGNTGPCTQFWLCLTYINEVGIKFSDGNFGPTIGVWRGLSSAHDCIQNAKHALSEGKKGLAVEWVMASQIHNPPVKDWLRDHGDAVVAALGMV